MGSVVGLMAIFVLAGLFAAYPRVMVAIGGGTIMAAIVLSFHLYLAERRRTAEALQVDAEVVFDAHACGEEKPLAISLRNADRFRSITRIEWNLAAFRPGYSSDVVRRDAGAGWPAWTRPLATDKVLEPMGSVILCFPLPPLVGAPDATRLEYLLTNKAIRFGER